MSLAALSPPFLFSLPLVCLSPESEVPALPPPPPSRTPPPLQGRHVEWQSLLCNCSCGKWKLISLIRFLSMSSLYCFFVYGWMPHNAGFGFLDLTPATLGQIHF
jgi:hypothetical protein